MLDISFIKSKLAIRNVSADVLKIQTNLTTRFHSVTIRM